MNIFLTVNNNWRVNTNKHFTIGLKGNDEQFEKLTNSKVIVYNKEFLLQNPNKKILKNKICACLNLNNKTSENNVFNNFKSLFEFLSFYNGENIFILGDLELLKTLLPYCSKAYITKTDENSSESRFFPNLDEDENWELKNNSNPLFEDEIVYYFCEYVNKNPLKYNYWEEDEIKI